MLPVAHVCVGITALPFSPLQHEQQQVKQQSSRFHRYGCEVEGGEGEGVTLPAGLFDRARQEAVDALAAADAAQAQRAEAAEQHEATVARLVRATLRVLPPEHC